MAYSDPRLLYYVSNYLKIIKFFHKQLCMFADENRTPSGADGTQRRYSRV